MENSKNVKIAIAIMTILLVSSSLVLAANTIEVTPVAATDYGDIMQYDWPQAGHDDEKTRFNPGPGPNRGDQLWTFSGVSGAPPVAFDDHIWVYSRSTLYALDPFTGEEDYSGSLNGTPAGFGSGVVAKLDDTYLGYLLTDGVAVYRIDDASFVTRYVIDSDRDGITNHVPGSIMYWVWFYDREDKVIFAPSRTSDTNEPCAVGYDMSDPTDPYIKWVTKVATPPEALGSGGGLIYFGGYGEGEIFAINATNGEIVWTNWKIGNAGYSATIYDGKLIHSPSSTRITAYDQYTGTILWDWDAGARAFFAYGGAAAYGRYFDKSILPGQGYAGAWDVETGEPLWRTLAHYYISYQTPAVADGKVYLSLSDQGAGSSVAGVVSSGYRFNCMDMITGEIIWEIPNLNLALPIVAYGNVYGISGGTVYCIGESKRDWSMWHNGENLGVAVGGHAPLDITTPIWKFNTTGPISGSPVVADGKVYVGSYNRNWYCLDANTGEKIWNYTIGERIRSTPAVVDGKLYTGADDGYIYCLDADTGEQLWDYFAGTQTNVLFGPTWQPRSSPFVVGDSVYVGSMDGNLYALTTSGNEKWKLSLTTPAYGIGGSPYVAGNTIYIYSADGYLNAVSTDGTLKWRVSTGMSTSPPAGVGTPIVIQDLVTVGRNSFMGGQEQRFYNITDGSLVMTASLTLASGAYSMTPQVCTPTYKDNAVTVIKGGEDNYFGYSNNIVGNYPTYYLIEGMYLSAWVILYPGTTVYNGSSLRNTPAEFQYVVNETMTVRAWGQFLGRQSFSSPVLADDPGGGKLYFGSDVYTVFCMNATDGTTLSVFEPLAQTFDTAAIYEGKMYIGSYDQFLYCFGDSVSASFSIFASSDKGETMWNNETLTIGGVLQPTVTTEFYGSFGANGLPNATVKVSLTKPDMTSENMTTTTDNYGRFTLSYSPTEVGDWGWVAWYDGEAKSDVLCYNPAYTEWNPFTVTSPTASEPEPPPEEGGVPVEYVYVAVAVIVIVLVAVGVYVFMRRGK
jgi:outer membrane protein assembly factor BamB